MLTQLVALRGEQWGGRPGAREQYDETGAPLGIMPLASEGCRLGGDVLELVEVALIVGLQVGFLA